MHRQMPELMQGFQRRFLDIPSVEKYHPERIQQAKGVQHHRDTVLDIACKEKPSGFYAGDQSSRQSVELRFGDFIDCYDATFHHKSHWLQSVEQLDFYLCQCPIAFGEADENVQQAASVTEQVPKKKQEAPVLPHVMDDFVVPKCLENQHLLQVNLWMSIHESRTSIHYDAYQNILVVLYGQKRVQLYSPQASASLYPYPIYCKSANHSRVNFTHPDLLLHPRFSEVSAQIVEVNAGDALFIPEGWWHQVDSQPFTIAVNFWFQGMREKLIRHNLLLPYYTRILVEEQLKLEKQELFKRLVEQHQHQHSALLSSMPSSKSQSSAAHQFVTCKGQRARESLLFAVSSNMALFRALQIRLATNHRREWEQFLDKSSNEMAAFLGDKWDAMMSSAPESQCVEGMRDEGSMSGSGAAAKGAASENVDETGIESSVDADKTEQSTMSFFEQLFGHQSEQEADTLKNQLLAKDTALTRDLCRQVLDGWLGLTSG